MNHQLCRFIICLVFRRIYCEAEFSFSESILFYIYQFEVRIVCCPIPQIQEANNQINIIELWEYVVFWVKWWFWGPIWKYSYQLINFRCLVAFLEVFQVNYPIISIILVWSSHEYHQFSWFYSDLTQESLNSSFPQSYHPEYERSHFYLDSKLPIFQHNAEK